QLTLRPARASAPSEPRVTALPLPLRCTGRWGPRPSLTPTTRRAATIVPARRAASAPPRTSPSLRHCCRNRSAGERIHHHIHAEARVVEREEALVVRMVVPLRGVVLAAVQHADAAVALHSLQVLVDEVVAPAVELVAGCGRSVW